MIRHRGENISSFALESEMLNLTETRECTTVAVPSGFSEDGIVVSPVEGAEIFPAHIHERLARVLPRYVMPHYLRIIDDLPKTSSGKVPKNL